jgi:glutamate--cysteine ligase
VDRRALRVAVAVPSPTRVLHAAEAGQIAADHGFVARPPSDERLVGIEVEWLTVALEDPARAADVDRTRAAAATVTPLPRASRVTFEPGGQVELSSVAERSLDAITAIDDDAQVLGKALSGAGIGLLGTGLEPGNRRPRAVRSPRYDAMESFFDATGVAGRTMMRSTAAIQVNLDLGTPEDTERRWRLTHAIGPVLAAAFANSPFFDGRPSGWRSTRLAVWNAIDPARTTPVMNGVDGPRAWARYALNADVMLIQRDGDEHVAIPPGFTFADWIEHGHREGWPTPDDLEYHLTTLFPPVRPRGWFELRMVDALPSPWWRVAAAMSAVLVNDPDVAVCARLGTEALTGQLGQDAWVTAARHGLDHPLLGAAAQRGFGAALGALPRNGADAVTIDAAAQFLDRYVMRGRCPADDMLDAWHRDGTLHPTPEAV